MFKVNQLVLGLLAVSGLTIVGCGETETTIVELESIIVEDDDDHDEGGHGRLIVTNADSAEAAVYDLEESSLLDSFSLTTSPSALHSSGSYRYAMLVDREGDEISFLDGGLYLEDHFDHFDEIEEAPVLLTYTVTGSRPTHVERHEGQLAVFFDGDADNSIPASVSVFEDTEITAEATEFTGIEYTVNMHGVAEPRDEYVLSTVRRDDVDTTSATPVLPDQVAVYHLHDDEYEQDEILAETCPDLHGSAQNEDYIIFGCSDGVLLVTQDEETFTAEKIINSDDVEDGLRIGSIYGHEATEQFIALASAYGGSSLQWFTIDPVEGDMELIDWESGVEGAGIAARGFSFEAEQFLILDDEGYLTVLESHEEDGHTHWEQSDQLDIKVEGLTYDDPTFTLAFSQNAHKVYISDSVARHILIIDMDGLDVSGDIELDFVPSLMTWIGIAEDHSHDE